MVTFGALTPLQGRSLPFNSHLTATTSQLSAIPATTALSTHSTCTTETTDPNELSYCVASCGGDLIIASGQQLQLVNLRDLEEKATRHFTTETTTSGGQSNPLEDICSGVWPLPQLLEQVNTWILETDAITFTVKHLSVSPNHRLIIAVGDRQLAVIALPTGRHHYHATQPTLPEELGSSKRKASSLYCSSFALGQQYHDDNTKTARILKVDWHPLSESDVHLGVLTDDGLLRLYDLGKNLEEPEQLIDLVDRLGFQDRMGKVTGLAGHSSVFTVDPESAQVMTFSFGRAETSWSSLAVYILMCNGDIYTLCPILPHRYRLRTSHVRLMLDQAELDRSELGFTDEEDIRTKLLNQQIKWLTWQLSMRPLDSKQQPDDTNDDIIVASKSNIMEPLLPTAHLRGPYLMQPAPWEIDDTIHSACDLVCLPANPTDLLAIAYTNGKIDICVVADPPEPTTGIKFWEQDELNLPCLAVHECLQLFESTPDAIQSTTRLIADPSYNDRFYCYHANGVFMVDCHSWLSIIERWWMSEGELDLNQEDLPKSTIKKLLSCVSNSSTTSNDNEAINNNSTTAQTDVMESFGLCISKDPSINYSMIYVSIRGQLVLQELPSRLEVEGLKKTVDEVNDETEVEQVSLLNIDTNDSAIMDPNRSTYATLLDANDSAKQAAQHLTEWVKILRENTAPRLASTSSLASTHGEADEESVEILEGRIKQCKQIIEAYLVQMKTVREAITYMEKRATTQQQEINRQRAIVNNYGDRIQRELKRQVDITQERMAKLLEQQRRLTRRAADLTHRSAAYRDPSLNSKEKMFLDSLHVMQQKLPLMFARIEQMSHEVKRVHRLPSSTMTEQGKGKYACYDTDQHETTSIVSEQYGALEHALQTE
ncbi:hypothetical protein BDF22DRAFT_690516 [Syncephalis plumigaleata]|nr:hypothetical protein BDF22DRAFT_690516 [Syncephalis plumigaleata]